MKEGIGGFGFVSAVLLATYGMLSLINPPQHTISYYQRRITLITGLMFGAVALILTLVTVF